MNADCTSVKRIIAERKLDADGNPKGFVLRNQQEQITLDPGKAWAQLDYYKWVTRGLIEEPSGFHVLPNGAVQIHGEQIDPADADGTARLEQRFNQHLEGVPIKPARSPKPIQPDSLQASGPTRVKFKVRLDKLGHLMVMGIKGEDRVETGIRGLESFVRDGMMLKPRMIHVDPLLSYVEIDDMRFDSNPDGAEALEKKLNSNYATVLKGDGHAPIEVRANPASASGFDIHFVITKAGAKFEVKGHLTQAQLDILQDPVKCQLLRPGIVLKISPPYLIIRRRRADASEEKIPELPDVHYLHVTAGELQRILNHPLLRRNAVASETETARPEDTGKAQIREFHILRQYETRIFMGLEIVTGKGKQIKAFTHHNVSELQEAGVFKSNLDVALSLDNRTLSILEIETKQEERIEVDQTSSESDLQRAGHMLTAALKPVIESALEPISSAVITEAPVSLPAVEPKPPPVETAQKIPVVAPLPEIKQPELPPQKSTAEPAPAVSETVPRENSVIRALFQEVDLLRANFETFRRLQMCLGMPVQDLLLSLDMVFHDRHFEIISFTHPEVSDVLEIRSDEFAGFYLTHINEHKVLLDFAWHGKRIEWGPQKCFLQTSVTAEPEEFGGSALLGMALPDQEHFAFVVTPAFKQWVKTRERLYQAVGASFITIEELESTPEKYPLVWPVP